MMTVPSQVTYMTAYDYFRTLFLSFEDQTSIPPSNSFSSPSFPNRTSPSNPDNSSTSIEDPRSQSPALASLSSPSLSSVTTHTVISTLLAGGIARALSATLVTPLELLRTRLQSSSSASSSSSSSSSKARSGALMTLIREVRTSPQGIKILYRGLAPTLWRDVPFSAIYFAGYEAIKRSLTGNGLGESTSSSSSQIQKDSLEEFSIAFLCGSISGTVAAVITHPADVVKTRLQARQSNADLSRTHNHPASSTSNKASNARLPSSVNNSHLNEALPTLRNLIKEEGLKGAFSGLSPRIAKIAPACGIMIGSFEVVGRALSDSNIAGTGAGNLSRGEIRKDVWIEGEELGAR